MAKKDIYALRWALQVSDTCLLSTCRSLQEHYSSNLIYNGLISCGVGRAAACQIITSLQEG